MKRLGLAAALGLAWLGLALLGGCHGGSGTSVTIEIIPPATGESVDVGVTTPLNFTATLGDDVTNAGVTWSLTGSGCSGNGCGTLANQQKFSVSYVPPTAIPSTTTALSVTLTATSVAQTGATQTTTINVEPLPTFTTSGCNPPIPTGVNATCGLAGASNGESYNEAIQITGGVQPYAFSVKTATVTVGSSTSATQLSTQCLGLSVTQTTSTSTAVAGKPCNAAAETVDFTIQVTDSGGAAPITQPYSMIVAAAPALSISATLSPPTANLNAQYSASVGYTGGVNPITWSISPSPASSLPPGLGFNTTNGQITGVPTSGADTGSSCTPAVAGKYCFSVTVTDSALLPPGDSHQTATQAYTLTVLPHTTLSITTPPGTLAAGMTSTGYTASIQATGGVTPYTWRLTQGQLPPGLTLSTSQGGNAVISGVPSVIGTYKFTVQVTDDEVAPDTQTQTATYTITISGGQNNNSLLQGSYAFIFRGFDKDGAVAMIGTLTSDGNGNLSGGEVVNRVSGVAPSASVTGTYEIDSNTTGTPNGAPGDGRGVMELTTSVGQQSVTSEYELALESDGSVQFIQDHDYPTSPSPPTNPDAFATHGAGVMKPIVGGGSEASFSGNYAFEFTGADANKKPDALAGSFHADGSAGTVTSGTCDFNDAGTYSSQSISGDFTFPGSTIGAAEFTIEVPNSGQQTLQFEYIFVSPSDLYFIETDASTTGTPTMYRMGGEAVLQQPNATFGASSLSGAAVVSTTGVDSGGNAIATAGLLTAGSATPCDGQTANTFGFDQNDNGTLTSPSATEICTVNPTTGRVAFTSQTPSVTVPFAAAYLVGPGEGFLIGSDATVTTGLLEQQTATAPLSSASISGAYAIGTPFVTEAGVNNLSGVVTADGAGTLSGTVDEADSGGATQTLNQPFAATISAVAANGRGTMTTTAAATGFPTNWIFYVVSPDAIRAIPADAGKPHPQIILLGPTTF
jgi:large repetitive protein